MVWGGVHDGTQYNWVVGFLGDPLDHPWYLPLSDGPLKVMIPENLTMEQVVEKNPLVELGGQYRPPDCWTRHHTAVVVPYYGQVQHLQHLLFHLHPFLQRQQLHYAIYVVNQVHLGWGGAEAKRPTRWVSKHSCGESRQHLGQRVAGWVLDL